MKKRISLFGLIFLVLLFIAIGGIKVKAAENTFHLITTNPGENASTTINVNYHCYKSGSHIEYTLASDKTFSNAKSIFPSEELWSIRGQDYVDPNDTFYTTPRYICKASLTNLQPCTKYQYRLVLGDEVSSTYTFVTAGLTNDWSFVAFGDFQYGNNKISHQMISLLREIAGNAPLGVAVGDMTDVSGYEKEVTWFLDNPVMQNFIFASAPGDHEYWSRDTSPKLFKEPYVYNATFNFPKNGSSLSLNSNYYFYYNNVLFVSIDTDDSDTVQSAKMTSQITWFKNTIPKLEGTYQYLVVLGHKSIYSAYSNDSRVFTTIRPQWYPVFDQFAVDLVISGHDHMYSRTYKLYNGKPITDRGEERYKGTYYLDMGSSGDKTRALEQAILEDGLHVDNTPDIKALGYSLGAHIAVSEDKMEIKVYNQHSNVVDSFTIYSKRDPLPVDVSEFNKENLFDGLSLSLESFSTKLGSLKISDGEMLKYVKNLKVTSGDETFLDTKINYYSNLEYVIKNMDKTSYLVTFTLNDNSEVSKEINLDYWQHAAIKLKNDGRLVMSWMALIGNLGDYTWDVNIDNTLVKTLQASDLMNGNIALSNQYLIGNHKIIINLMDGDKKIDEYSIDYEGCDALELTKEEINLKVGETENLDYDFEYDDLVRVKVSDATVASYKDGVVTALKEGETEIIFEIKNSDYTYKCLVKVTNQGGLDNNTNKAKSGCNANSAVEMFSLIGVLAFAMFIKKRTFNE